MLKSEGYAMFEGTATITPLNDTIQPFDVTGVWLYKPTHDSWYVNGRSFIADIVSNIREKDK